MSRRDRDPTSRGCSFEATTGSSSSSGSSKREGAAPTALVDACYEFAGAVSTRVFFVVVLTRGIEVLVESKYSPQPVWP